MRGVSPAPAPDRSGGGVSLESRATRPFSNSCPPGPSQIEAIGQYGMEHAPLEACGILIVDGPHRGIAVIQNYADLPASNSLMRVDDILDGILSLTGHITVSDDLASRLIFWHTHPGGQLGPSKIDLVVREQQPTLRMLVVAIPSGEAVEY